MAAEKQTVMSCPTPDQLSAWYDSELRDAELEAHLNSCGACKRIVASYETIDTQLRDTLEAATDEGTQTRIRTGSLAKIRTRDERDRARAMWTRVAAVAAVAAALVGALVYLNQHSRSQLDPDPGSGHANPGLVVNYPGYQPGELDLSTAALVACAADETAAKDMQAKLTTAETGIHQIWSVEDPATPLQLIHDLLQNKYQDQVANLIATNADSRSILLEVDQRQLQELVNHLDSQGCELISTNGPQPGSQPDEPTADAKPVHYMADFVRR